MDLITFHAEYDFALTYSTRRRALALECAWAALSAAIRARRPDLAHRANTLLGALQ